MKQFSISTIPSLLSVIFLAGCAATQDVPISSIPTGASIYVNGEPQGETPRTLTLKRTQPHIITLKKDGYMQRDIMIKRVFHQDKAMMRATARGLNSAKYLNSPSMGISSGLHSYAADDQTGESYTLTPTAVSVQLVPLGNTAKPSPAANVQQTDHGDQLTEGPDTKTISAGTLIKTAGAVGSASGPKVGKTWSSKSTKTKESFHGTTYKKTKTTTKASVGVKADTGKLIQTGANLLGNAVDSAEQ